MKNIARTLTLLTALAFTSFAYAGSDKEKSCCCKDGECKECCKEKCTKEKEAKK